MEIAFVDFTGGMDGVHAIYVDGTLFKYGDYYHNKIENWYSGFKKGLSCAKCEFKETIIEITDEDLIEDVSGNASIPPQTLEELIGKY